MENASLLLNHYSIVILPVLLLLILLLLLLVMGQQSKLTKLQKKYNYFTKGETANIDEVLTKTLEELANTQAALQELQAKHQKLRTQVKSCLQVVKMDRYDAFDAMGGKLSYSLLLEDEENNGVLLTSIYGREESRCFAKMIKQGASETPLAEEEKKLLQSK